MTPLVEIWDPQRVVIDARKEMATDLAEMAMTTTTTVITMAEATAAAAAAVAAAVAVVLLRVFPLVRVLQHRSRV